MQRHGWPWLAPHGCDAAVAALAGERPAVVATDLDLELQLRVQRVVHDTKDLPGDGLAVVVVRRTDGRLVAVLGDRDPRAPLDLSRRPRSAGSTLKPFLYALAQQRGAIAAATLVEDLPRTFDDWQPANFDRRWLGRARAGDALACSSNLAAVRCLEAVGTSAFAAVLQSLGLREGEHTLHLDGALGTDAVTPRQLAFAYWRFVAEPGSVGLSPASVTWTLRALSRLPLVAGHCRAGDVAWKSGTSSGRRDAWCVAITAEHVVVVWLGNRDGRGLADLVGARCANRLLAAVLAVLATSG
jgi:penicillin-binding protein 1C